MRQENNDSTTIKAVEVRAYQLWEQRGRPDGTAQSDWLNAEALLKSEPHTNKVGTTPAPQVKLAAVEEAGRSKGARTAGRRKGKSKT